MDNDEMLVLIKDMFDKKVDEVKAEMSELKVEIRDVKNHTGILIESLRSDIKAVAEGHSALDKKIDDTKNELKVEIKELKDDIHVIRDYVIGVDKKLNEHEVILKRVK